MTRKGRSFYIESHGPDDAALARGLSWLVEESKKASGQGMVAVCSKVNLDNLSWSQNHQIFDALRKAGKVTVAGVSIVLFTKSGRKTHHGSFDGPILVIHGGQDLLDAVDAIEGTADALAVPWLEGECSGWASTWNAAPLGGQPQANQPTEGIAFVALETLAKRVNLSTGIGHPSDRLSAIRTLETLFHKGVSLSPEEIRQQMIRLGMSPDHARDVGDLAAMISEGRKPKGSTGEASEEQWQFWQGKLKSED